MIAGVLGLPALKSASPVGGVSFASPSPVPSPMTLPVLIPDTLMYPVFQTRLSLTVKVAGIGYPVVLPQGGGPPQRPIVVPPGKDEQVNVTVTNPGPASASNVWFAVVPASRLVGPSSRPGTSLEHTSYVMSEVSELPSGTSNFTFTVPAADLQRGSLPVIVMGAQEGSNQVTYGIARLVIGESSANG